MEEEPAEANERNRDFEEDEGRATRHRKVLLPKRHEVIGEGDDVVHHELPVAWCLDSRDEVESDGVIEEVSRDEGASPHVTIPWDLPTLFIVEKSFSIWARPQETVYIRRRRTQLR